MTLVKSYYSRYMTAAGESVAPGELSDEAVLDRIRTDPAFARATSQWLVELAKQASASLEGQAPVEAASKSPQVEPASPDVVKAKQPSGMKAPVDPSSVSAAASQTAATSVAQSTVPDRYLAQSTLTVSNFPKFFAQDQIAFWSQPFHSKAESLTFWLPASFGTAALIGADTDIESHLPKSSSLVKNAANGSTAGMLALVGMGGGLYLLGKAEHDQHKLETGYLVGEAAIDAYVASTSLQYITQRERPFTGNNKGQFFYGGNSFPSNTAAVSWAAASVLAREYPGTLTKLFVYGIAAGVSAGRVIGQKHWTSDAVLGSAMGWYMGRQIYRARAQGPDIDAKNWGTFERGDSDSQRDAGYMGTTFMPLDSWVYPAFDRLAALGYIPTALLAIRPWPRMECARLTLEAEERLHSWNGENAMVRAVVKDLRQEFAMELANLEGASNVGVQLESAYVRGTEIAGRPLRDSFNFAQSLFDDFGRPYGQGFNTVDGASVRAEAGPLAFYFRGEYQHSSSLPNYSPAQALRIVQTNDLPYLPLSSVPTFNSTSQFQPIEAYAALNVANWQISFGYQTFYWGPDRGGSLMFSNNARAEPMLKFGRVVPYELPEPFAWLGKIRNTIFVGALPDYHWVRGPYPTFPIYGSPYQSINPLPYTWGDKLALKMTENFEVGVGLSVIWAGYGRPATLKTWMHTVNTNGSSQANDPGKRYTGINCSYRLPKLRDWVTFYVDGMANDQPNPIAYPQDSAFNPGLYFPKLPKLHNLELRVEGVYTNIIGYVGVGEYYKNIHYAQGYTNNWQIIGSWVGRQGDGIWAESTYWFSPRNKLAVAYRRQWVDPVLLGGGGLNDVSASIDWLFKHSIQLSSTLQVERWNFPLLSPTPVYNVSTGLQITFLPPGGRPLKMAR
jgi:membrane-associated phospholipid phosphatase